MITEDKPIDRVIKPPISKKLYIKYKNIISILFTPLNLYETLLASNNDRKEILMKASTHLVSRMGQRAISKAELDIVMAFGEVNGDKVIVNKRRAKELLVELEFLLACKKERVR